MAKRGSICRSSYCGVDPDMQSIVIDLGTAITKIGYGGDDSPRIMTPTVVGVRKRSVKDKFDPELSEDDLKRKCVGEEAISQREKHNLRYPIERGQVTNWNCLEQFLSGNTTGLSFESGHGRTSIVPIYEGYAIPAYIETLNISGQDISSHMIKKINERNDNGSKKIPKMPNDDYNIMITKIKKKFGYLSQDYYREMDKKLEHEEFELSDGHKIKIGDERFEGPEILFQPSIIGSQKLGIEELMYNSIQKCDKEIRNDMYANILVSGGSTMFQNFESRLFDEIKDMVPKTTRVKVSGHKEKDLGVWIGGSILSSLTTFQNMWVTDDEYDSAGATIVHRKCF